MGLSTELAGAAVRFSLGRETTELEIDRAAEIVGKSIFVLFAEPFRNGNAKRAGETQFRVSAATDVATVGSAFSFKVTTAGSPAPTLDRAGALPAGVTFTSNGDGTGTLSGTPTAAGSFPLTFTARNATGTTSQAFRLTVDKTPAFTTATTVKETAGMAFTAIAGASGFPAPKLSSSGLPDGVSFSDNGGGAGTLSGTAAVKPGTYPVTITASNAAGTVTRTVTLSVKTAGSNWPLEPSSIRRAASTWSRAGLWGRWRRKAS